MPAGATGEILVRGPGVIHGYENDPAADRLAFHHGWWRTGDLGHLDDDGYLYITGRVKQVINRGGRKVSPNEVDELFMQHPAVREAATFGVPHPSLGTDVVTAIILREPASVTAQQLRDYALRRIAAFKAPTSVLLVDDFPRSALGKVKRQTLAETLAGTLQAEFVAPRGADQKLIADVFASVLDLPQVGASDNFFHLGGDSLRAARVLSRLLTLAGVELEPLAVFEAPTVGELAQRLAAARDAAERAGTGAQPPLRRRHHGAGAVVVDARRLPKQRGVKQ